MKFLILGDVHERVDNPENRTDSLLDALNNKVAEVKEIAKEHKVKAILETGDFLNTAKLSNEVLKNIMNKWSTGDLNEILDLLEKNEITEIEVLNKIKKIIRIIGVVGNHETFGNSMKNFHKTGLSLLIESGLIEIASIENPIVFKTEDGVKVAITGANYHNNIDKEDKSSYIVKEKLGDVHIHIVHGYLTKKYMGNIFDHTTVDEIANETKADITITGHDHIGFDPIEVNGKYFLNPGALLRTSNDEKEIKRKPKVFILTLTKEGVNFEKIYLKSALPGNQVLSREKINEKNEINKKIEGIKSLVNKTKVEGGLSIIEIIEKISNDEHIEEGIKNEIVKDITNQMEKLTNSNIYNDYYIEKIELENFQSHKHTVLNFSKGLNVITGESCRGKSSILRAMELLYDNKKGDVKAKNIRNYIKVGENYAKVTITLSNGYSISRIIEKKKNGKNGYIISAPNSTEEEYNNTKCLPVVQEILGFNKLKIDTSREIPLNFMSQGKSWYFIGDGYTDSDRSKIIGSIYNTQFLDSLVKDLESNIKRNNTNLKIKNEDLNKIEDNINKYSYLDDMKEKIEKADKLYIELEALLKKKERLIKLIDAKEEIKKEGINLKNVVNKLNIIKNYKEEVELIKNNLEKRKNLNLLILKKENIKLQGQSCVKVVKKLKDIKNQTKELYLLKSKIKDREVICEKIKTINKLKSKKNNIEKQITICEKIKEKVSNNTVDIKTINEIKNKLTLKDSLAKLLKDKNNITKEGMKEVKIIKECKEKRNSLLISYKELLLEVGECPVCRGTIDKAVVNSIINNLNK